MGILFTADDAIPLIILRIFLSINPNHLYIVVAQELHERIFQSTQGHFIPEMGRLSTFTRDKDRKVEALTGGYNNANKTVTASKTSLAKS